METDIEKNIFVHLEFEISTRPNNVLSVSKKRIKLDKRDILVKIQKLDTRVKSFLTL